MKMKAYTVCARAQASIFMVFWPFSPKKIVKLLKKSERWPNKWSKVKTLEDKPRSARLFFHKLCEKYYQKSCKTSILCLIIPQNRAGKKFQLHIIDQSFEHNGKGILVTKKSWKALKRNRQCTLHASMVSEGFANFILWCEPPREHLDYCRRDNRQRSSPQNTGRANTVTTLRLEECDFGHALGARTFYTSPLRKCQKTYRKTYWLVIF